MARGTASKERSISIIKFSRLGSHFLLAAALYAELPPQVYEKLKADAPELVKIKVTQVKATETPKGGYTQVLVEAKVEVVNITRSATQLKKGSALRVLYQTETKRTGPWVGPSPIPILTQGQVSTAYLQRISSKNPSVYEPAARGQSFQ